ncbi:MAG: TetR/AcrR family transcriptional regulator [Lachnospiraceae bacterium]|nr:TetR/AcrR family transcriptional regulator [Lachnospiraceae bacterium]
MDNKLKKALKQNALMEAAFELFTKQGFGKTSISEIAEKAEVAKGTFYLYFKDKYDLRSRITAHKAEQILHRARQEAGITEDMDFEEMLLRLISRTIDILAEDKLLAAFLVKNLGYSTLQKSGLLKEAVEMAGGAYKDPEIMLCLILELTGSASYSAIAAAEPVNISELKPHLLGAISAILEKYRKE